MDLCIILLLAGFLFLRLLLKELFLQVGLGEGSAVILSGFVVSSLQIYVAARINCPVCKDLIIFYTCSFIVLDIFTAMHIPFIFFIIYLFTTFAIMNLLEEE